MAIAIALETMALSVESTTGTALSELISVSTEKPYADGTLIQSGTPSVQGFIYRNGQWATLNYPDPNTTATVFELCKVRRDLRRFFNDNFGHPLS